MTQLAYDGATTAAGSARRIPWWLFATVLGIAAAIALASLAVWGWGADGRLHVTRYTARLSFLLFVTVFAAGALAQLLPSAPTRWLRRNRRYLGLSFALAHFLHLAALTAYFVAIGETPGTATLVLGGLAYVFIALMALTSNDWSVRTLGPAWRVLHLVGAYYVWLIFMNSYVGRVLRDAPPEPRLIFIVTSGLGALALVVRIVAWGKRLRARRLRSRAARAYVPR